MKKIITLVVVALLVVTLGASAFAYEYTESVDLPTKVLVSGTETTLQKWSESNAGKKGDVHFVLTESQGQYFMYALARDYSMAWVVKPTTGLFTSVGTLHSFSYDSQAKRWNYNGSSTVSSSSPAVVSDVSSILWASHDLINNTNGLVWMEGDENFLKPPPEELYQISVEEAVAQIPANIGGQMMTLTICGITCMGLVIGLMLFGKRFLIYLRG